MIRKIFDAGDFIDGRPQEAVDFLSESISDEKCAAIDNATENLRGLTSTIRALSMSDVTLGADPVDALRDINTLTKFASIELETIARILSGDE